MRHNVPAIATWAISLVFGFGLNLLDVMPYFYLFLPTWAVSIIAYVVLARRYGVAEKYPEAEAAEHLFQKRVADRQSKQAEMEGHDHKRDTSLRTRVIKAVWIVFGLTVPCVLAWLTLFHSPDLFAYYVNVERFYSLTIGCTFIYFIFAYWGLLRAKAFHRARQPAKTEPLA